MAIKSFNVNTGNQYIKGYVELVSNSLGTLLNQSEVTAALYLHRSNNYSGTPTFGQVSCKFTINGQTFTTPAVYKTIPNDKSYVEIGRATTTIQHNDDGTKTINVSVETTSNNNSLLVPITTSSFTLDAIPRYATITSNPNFNDEESPTLGYSNIAGNIVTTLEACISVDGTSASIPYRSISKTGTSYKFELTENERNILRNSTPNSNNKTIYYLVKTIINGVTFTQSASCTLTIVNANPTFTTSNVSYQDGNSSVVAITENNQKIVQNKSDLRVTFTSATPLKGSSISNYEFKLNDTTQTKTTPTTIDFGTIDSANDLTLVCKVTDSRGNTTTIEKTISMVSYETPNAIVTLNRLNNYEDETYLNVDGTIASVLSKNVMTIQYRYKENGGSYNAYTTIPDNVQQTLQLDKNKEFIFEVKITDSFNETFRQEYTLGKGIFPLFIDTAKNSVGVNCFPSKNNTLEVDGIVNNYLIGSIMITNSSTNPSGNVGGTWSLLVQQTISGVTLYYWKRES